MWPQIKSWCYHSATVAWGYFKILVGATLFVVHDIVEGVGSTIANPDVKSALTAMNFPNYVTLGLALIGMLTIAVRLRPASKDPLI